MLSGQSGAGHGQILRLDLLFGLEIPVAEDRIGRGSGLGAQEARCKQQSRPDSLCASEAHSHPSFSSRIATFIIRSEGRLQRFTTGSGCGERADRVRGANGQWFPCPVKAPGPPQAVWSFQARQEYTSPFAPVRDCFPFKPPAARNERSAAPPAESRSGTPGRPSSRAPHRAPGPSSWPSACSPEAQ